VHVHVHVHVYDFPWQPAARSPALTPLNRDGANRATAGLRQDEERAPSGSERGPKRAAVQVHVDVDVDVMGETLLAGRRAEAESRRWEVLAGA
jgi:hypothetical protein